MAGFDPHPHAQPSPSLVGEILSGLLAERKTLPPKLFYDEEGCRLFGLITELPEYYPTRTECLLLEHHAAAIAAAAPEGAAIVEYGASHEMKASFLIGTGRFACYVPVDIAPEALAGIVTRLAAAHPALTVRPVCADFMRPLRLPDLGAAAPFGFFPGSTIGNMDPETAVAFLASMRTTLSADPARRPRLVIGTDLRKDEETLVAAYDDGSGVTALFNRNMLAHVNRVATGDLDPERFVHRATWNARESRIEMHLVSRDAQSFQVGGRTIRFEAGETIHTESSYKYTRDGFAGLVSRAGWRAMRYWTDERRLFGIHLLEVDP